LKSNNTRNFGFVVWTFLITVSSILHPCSVVVAQVPAPIVVANGENLTGSWGGDENNVAEFKGIPFAAPPVGDLRWRAPKPNIPRTGQLTALDFAPACMQSNRLVEWYAGVAQTFGHGPEVVGRPKGLSEDCLYLNVWTPKPGDESNLPVMVFVHGGSNSSGWSYEPNYVGSSLAARGVVVVTVAYRVGPFGFFSHPALDNDQGEPIANFGLLDIQAAFQWVRAHISKFGGDPENITGFGESSGAYDLLDLLLVDISNGRSESSLFRRLVSQSIGGPLLKRQTLAEEQEIGVLLAKQLGYGEEVSAENLRDVPAEDLVEASSNLPADHYFDAVVDGKTVVRHPLESLRRAHVEGVDLIAGTNADEWYMYFSEDTTQADLENWISENVPEQREAILAAVADEPDYRHALDLLRTGRNMLCPSRYLAKRVNESGGRAWVYHFTRQRSGSGGERLRAYHGIELPYVFDRHDDWLPTGEVDRQLTEAVMDYWVQFASTGNPNLPGRPQWPVHSRQNPAVLELGDRIGVEEPRNESLCDLLWPGSEETGEDS